MDAAGVLGLFVVLWASGHSTLLMIKLQQLLMWVGGWVGCFCGCVSASNLCCSGQSSLQKLGGSKATRFPKMKLGLMITKYKIRA